jgi:hypothetical protein
MLEASFCRIARAGRRRVMSLFVINGDKLTAVEDTSYLNEGVLERRHLQALLKHTLINAETSPFGDDLKLICEEFSNWDGGTPSQIC